MTSPSNRPPETHPPRYRTTAVNRRPPRSLIAAAALTISALSAGGQSAAPSPTPAPTLLRAWILPAGEMGNVALVAQSQGESGPMTLAASQGGQRQVGPAYRAVRPGNATVEVRSGDQVLASGTAPLADGRQYTLVAWKTPTKWELKLFADGPPAPNAPDRPIRILNFAQGRETAVVVSGGTETRIKGDDVRELRVPPKVTGVAVSVLAADGSAAAQTSVEFDLSSAYSGYVVVAPDYRGRFRPAIILGGEPPTSEEPVATSESPESPEARIARLTRMDLEHELGQILVQMNQPGEEGKRAALQAKKQELERRLKGGDPAPAPAPTPAPDR